MAILFIGVAPVPCQRIDMDAVEASVLFRTGVRTYHRGVYQSSILSFERSLTLKPEDFLVQGWLASANYRAGYVDAAIRRWRDLAKASYDSAVTKDRLQFATFRYGLGRELQEEPTWVLAYEILSLRGEAHSFRRPVSVRARTDGSLAVVSLASNQLVLVDVNGAVLDTLRGGLYGFDRPFDVLELPDGYLVSEFGGRRIVRCGPTGQRKLVFGTEPGAPKLMGPQFLAADGEGYVYVTDWGAGRVHKYELGGRYVLSFGQRLEEPTGIAVLDGEVYVCERSAGRIAVFDQSGNFLRSLGEGQLQSPEGICFWDERTVLVADTTRLLAGDIGVDRWSEWGNLGALSQRLTSVTVDAGGAIYLADMDAERLFVLTRQPNLVVGNNVWIGRISGDSYPAVTMEVEVTDRYGRPVTGLRDVNFLVTEASAPVSSLKLARSPVDPSELDVVVVVDQSPAIEGYAQAIRAAILELHDELARSSRLSFVGGTPPTVVAPAGLTRLRVAEAVSRGVPSRQWRLDAALRVAANELATAWGRKAVIYLSAGGVGARSFEATSLAETAAALANNHIGLVVMSLTDAPLPEEIGFLVRSTGGRIVGSDDPRGVAGLGKELAARVAPVYLLSYASSSFTDYGRRYLPVRVEVVLPGSSGGDTSGYFAPENR